MMLTPHFWILYVGFVLTSIGGLMITAQASPVGKSLKIAAWAWLRRYPGAVSPTGRSHLWGWFSDLVGREMAMSIPFTIQAALPPWRRGRRQIGPGTNLYGIEPRRLVYRDMILIYFTWGSMFSLFPGDHWRLLWARVCDLQLRFSLYGERRRFHRRRRHCRVAFHQVWKLEYSGLLDRGPDAGFRGTGSGAPFLAATQAEQTGSTRSGHCQSWLKPIFRQDCFSA